MSKINVSDITLLIKEQINAYMQDIKTEKFGTVINVGDGIAIIHGLSKAMQGELLVFPNNIYGMVLNLEYNTVGAIILGDYTQIKDGDIVKCSGRILEIPVGEAYLGRIVNPLGQPLDGKGDIICDKMRPIEAKATCVMDRSSINEPLQTGIKVIDALVPIGKGQRELIIGDRQTGKTSLAIDAIINQKDKNVICIYVAIGQKESTVAKIIDTLKDNDAMEHTIIISASASKPSPLLYLAPYAGVTLAEEFMFNGHDVLIVYDDLSKHSVAYRELSLLLHRPPGREAFPGDVFYLHSRLLERSAKLNEAHGGGSITALPIIETQAGDISAYIPTNVISITDGQIFLQNDLFYSGIRPAINPGLSVSRVGGAAQTKAVKSVSGTLRLDLASYRELEAFTQFGSDLDQATKNKLERGKRTIEILKQDLHELLSFEEETIVLYALTRGFLDNIELADIKKFEHDLIMYFNSNALGISLLKEITETKKLPEVEKLNTFLKEFKKNFFFRQGR